MFENMLKNIRKIFNYITNDIYLCFVNIKEPAATGNSG